MKKLVAIILIFILALQTASIVYAWEVERPAKNITIGERTENASTNGEASVGIGVAINYYTETPNDYGADFVSLNVSMTANSRIGITYDCSWDSVVDF